VPGVQNMINVFASSHCASFSARGTVLVEPERGRRKTRNTACPELAVQQC
jgi:hypothetical protein